MSRFPGRRPLLYALTRAVEWLTLACADAVIATNESYRQVAINRGGVPADRVAVVRSAPDLTRFMARPPTTASGAVKVLAGVHRVMGPQDGVDYALRALQHLRDDLGRDDVQAIFMGSGDGIRCDGRSGQELGIDDFVEFPGRVPDEYVQRCLSTADVCLSPDPMNPLNDVSTMNKVVEYMAMGRPIVSFDLTEARVSAGESATYVPVNDELAFAKPSTTYWIAPMRVSRWEESDGNVSRPSCPGRHRGAISLISTTACSELRRTGFGQFLGVKVVENRMTTISVHGLGYVGCVSAACLASMGFRVIGSTSAMTKLRCWLKANRPWLKKIGELTAEVVASGMLTVTSDSHDAVLRSDISLICVGTPSTTGGGLSTVYLETVSAVVGSAIKKGPTAHRRLPQHYAAGHM